MGYHQAGFDVVGVDIKPQPRYPFPVIVTDALSLDVRFIRWFDAVHASPECQGYTAMRNAPGAKGRPQMIGPVRDMLIASGKPWTLENVEAAAWAMPGAVRLCGTMFGLGAHGCDLHRHRLFQTNWGLQAPGPCQHGDGPVVGIYGGHARVRSARHGGRSTRDAWPNGHKPVAAEAMGMDWATLAEMSEAIPPAYTRFIGEQLLAHVQGRSLAA
jgi:DNA (cytosine-5)-methyltransferase 1